MFVVLISKIGDIAIMFFASFVIACSMEPIVQKLEPKYGRNIASSIVLFGGILLLIAIFVPIIIIGGNEIKIFAENAPQYLETLMNLFYTNPILQKTNFSQIGLGEVISSASTVSSKVITEVISFSKNIGSGFVYLLISILVIYYFLTDKEVVKNAIMRLFPVQMRKRTSEIYDNIFTKIGGYIVAQVTTMLSVGVVVTIGLLLLKVDYALLLGIICTVFDLVPVAGPAVAFVVCMIVVYKHGPLIMLATALIFFIAQLIENNFVRPYVFGKLLNIHPLMIYLFIFIAAKYIGVLGVIFAPAIAALVVVLIEDVYMKSLEEDK